MYTKSLHWNLLNWVHYKAMRIVLGDPQNKMPRREIDRLGKCSTPYQWMLYSNTKMAIILYNLGVNGPWLSERLINRCYRNDRLPGMGTFIDTSRLAIGRQSFVNRLMMLRKVTIQWTNGINPHRLWQNLKSVFHSVNLKGKLFLVFPLSNNL